MDGQTGTGIDMALARAFALRTVDARDRRLADALGLVVQGLADVIRLTNASRADLTAVIGFLTEVGEACDDQRQEWVLLADVLGITGAIEDHHTQRPAGATPNTISGPFYRPGAPLRADGDSICLDGQGEPLALSLVVAGPDGAGIEGAVVEVWQANAAGLYENQAPDLIPEFNLRGTYRSGADGLVSLRTVRPGGYSIPVDGPVGRLMARLGLATRRPAHLHFRIQAPGFQTLTTHVFDASDPALDRDPLVCVRPELLAGFHPAPGGGWTGAHRFVLARAAAAQAPV